MYSIFLIKLFHQYPLEPIMCAGALLAEHYCIKAFTFCSVFKIIYPILGGLAAAMYAGLRELF